MVHRIEIVSGEGDDNEMIEEYTGMVSVSILRSVLDGERCEGERWAYLRIDGERIDDRPYEEGGNLEAALRWQITSR
jgi:hypothetical protein